MALRDIFEQPLFVNIKEALKPKPEFLQRSVPSAEPTGYKQAVERSIPALGQFGQAAIEFPGRPVREVLEQRGVNPGLALAAGFAADITTPLPGGEFQSGKKIFGGFKDLTTKFLEHIKGKESVSRQEIADFARRPELKKGEADLLLNKLKEFEKTGIEMPISDVKPSEYKFRGKAIPENERELMGFNNKIISKIKDSLQKGGQIRPIDVRYEKGKYIIEDGSHRYEAHLDLGRDKIKLVISGGDKFPAQEFADALRADLLELKPVKVEELQYQMTTIHARQGGIKNRGNNYEEVVFESPITTNVPSHFPNSKNYFAHARGDEVIEGGKKIWREQEIQSDLLQKDNLKRLQDEAQDEVSNYQGRQTEFARNKVIENNKLANEVQKLKPFTNDRFGERIMRERIREKAQKGYEKYRLPTGKTIGKIEVLGETSFWTLTRNLDDKTRKITRLKDSELKIGDFVSRAQIPEPGLVPHWDEAEDWIITDILGDGRFKAVPKEFWERFNKQRKPEYKLSSIKEIRKQSPTFTQSEETVDLTGKSNPQYIRYENWGKFLKNKYGGKVVTDSQGNTWFEVELRKEMGRLPVEAFGVAPLLFPKSQEQKEKNNQPLFINAR